MLQNVMIPKISVLVFCFNEENYIKSLIENISFADEIIFIDNNSTDKTVTIATELGATVIPQTTTNKIQQQNLIVTKNDWVLVLDINEYLSQELKEEIFTKISNPKTNDLYYIKQTLFFFNKRIKYGRFNRRKKIFLFNKKNHVWAGDQPDKSFVPFFRKSSVLKNRVDSYAYKSFDEYNHQLSVASKKEAQVLYQKNIKPNIYHFFLKPFFNFVNEYFIKLGFTEGKEGYILAYINSFAILKRYLILWLLYNNME